MQPVGKHMNPRPGLRRMIDTTHAFTAHMMLQLPLVAHKSSPENSVVILGKRSLRRRCHPEQAFFAPPLSS
jgi:hypothetical protein